MKPKQAGYEIHIPPIDDIIRKQILLHPGDILFILGPNGAGKSGLLYYINKDKGDKTYWIKATRQTFFRRGLIMLQPNNVRETEKQIQREGIQPTIRFDDTHARDQPNLVMSKLMHAIHKQNNDLSQFTRLKKGIATTFWEKHESLLDTLNRILRSVNLPVVGEEIGYDENVLVHNNDGSKYDITQLSDGERTAVLIAAEIILAPKNTVILIDEPERHLHRSITSPFLQKLFSERSDCCFIVSTHDVTLPPDNPESQTVLVRSCKYMDGVLNAWDYDLIKSDKEINPDVLTDILGSRRKLLVVEGKKNSLDKQLYSTVLPQVSIIPKDGFTTVKQVVTNIRNSDQFHWLQVYGLIDKDNRTSNDIEDLQELGIYSLSVHSVESLYYSQTMLKMVLKYALYLEGDEVDTRLTQLKNKSVQAFSQSIDYLSSLIVEQKIKSEVLKQIPDHSSNKFDKLLNISVDPSPIIRDVSKQLQKFVDTNNFDVIVANYPMGKTRIPSCITKELGLTRETYVQTVCRMVQKHEDARNYVIEMLGKLYENITQ